MCHILWGAFGSGQRSNPGDSGQFYTDHAQHRAHSVKKGVGVRGARGEERAIQAGRDKSHETAARRAI